MANLLDVPLWYQMDCASRSTTRMLAHHMYQDICGIHDSDELRASSLVQPTQGL